MWPDGGKKVSPEQENNSEFVRGLSWYRKQVINGFFLITANLVFATAWITIWVFFAHGGSYTRIDFCYKYANASQSTKNRTIISLELVIPKIPASAPRSAATANLAATADLVSRLQMVETELPLDVWRHQTDQWRHRPSEAIPVSGRSARLHKTHNSMNWAVQNLASLNGTQRVMLYASSMHLIDICMTAKCISERGIARIFLQHGQMSPDFEQNICWPYVAWALR